MNKIFIYSFCIIFSFCIPIFHVTAENQNCTVDLLTNLPNDINWNNAYIIRGSDGSLWQRAILSQSTQKLIINEGEESYIEGTGQPFSDVQIFVFPPKYDNNGALQKPDPSLCFDWESTNNQGFFRFPINAQMIWGNIGDDIVFDAYTHLKGEWEQYSEENTNQNFFIGTGLPPRTLNIGVDPTVQKGCKVVCEDTGVIEAVSIDPGKANPPDFGNIFESIKYCPVSIARMPGENTFYSKVIDQKCFGIKKTPDPFDLQKISAGTTIIEYIKRILLGDVKYGGSSSNFLSSPLLATDVKRISRSEPSDDNTYLTVETIKMLLTDVDETNIDKILSNLNSLIPHLSKEQHKKFTLPIFSYPLGVSHSEGEEESTETWPEDFISIVSLWTGSLFPNSCTFSDDVDPPALFHHMSSDDPSVGSFSPSDGDFCNYVYVQGSDPMLLIHSDEAVSVQPSFTGTMITTANRPFDEGEKWIFSGEEEKKIRYGIDFSTEFSPSVIDEHCTDRNSFLDTLSSELSLKPEEVELINSEFDYYGIDTEASYLFSIFDPSEINSRISWKMNGKKMNVMQLFFTIEDECNSEENIYFSDFLFPEDREAFEVGILP